MATGVVKPGVKVPPEPSLPRRLVGFYNGVIAEMKRVTWPDVPQVRDATWQIIVFVLVLALVITLLDFVLNGVLVSFIPGLFAK